MPETPPFVIKSVDPAAINESNSGAQAAYITNLQYRIRNNPETLTAGERAYAQNEESLRDARAEALKHQVAFSQPRNDLDVPRSARFQQIEQEYGLQRYSTIGGYTPVRHPEVTVSPTRFEDSAAGIAQQLALSGGRVGPSVAATARAEGYAGNLNVSEFSGRATVPTRGERTELTDYEKELVGYATRQFSGAMGTAGKIRDLIVKQDADLAKTPFRSSISNPISEPNDPLSVISRTITGGIGSVFGGFREAGSELYKGIVLPGVAVGRATQQSAVALQMDTMGRSPGSGIDYDAIANVARFMNRPAATSQGVDIFGFRSAGATAGQSAINPQVKYYNNARYSEDVGLSATFVGRGAAPVYSPIPGSVTERFAFDEYGKVLVGGQKFEPAFSREGIPYNTKMGAGEYVYVGEYQYQGGERVSRYVEKNVGSYVDFGQSGMAFRKEVNIRGGGSPGAYYATAQQVDVPSGSAVKGTSGFDIFGTIRGAVDFGYNLPSYAVSRGNEMFAQIPVLSQVNLAGREAGIGMEISQQNEYLFAKTKGYEEAGLIKGGMFTGTQGQYADLIATQNRIGVLQGEQGRIRGELTGNVSEAMLITKPVYDVAHGASQWWGENVGKTYEKTIAPLTGPVGSGVEKFLNDNRGNIAAVGMIPGIGAPFKMLASENPLMLNAPSKVSEASIALVGVPGQMLEFGGMAVVGGEILARNPIAIPALGAAGLMMQGQGIEEGIRTRPTGFFYEQMGMIALSEVAIRGVQKASPVGGGILEVPTFEKGGPATTYYAAYTKMPFAGEGGVPRFMAGVAKTGGRLSANFAAPSFDVKIIPQNPIAMGRVPFYVPKSSEMGFFGIRAPIATEANPMFGIGYTKVPGGRASPFIGSPASKFSSLIERGWKFGHLFPFEFEKGYAPGLTSAERFVLPPSIMKSREFGIMQDVMKSQDFLQGKSEISQKRPYDYRHADVTQTAWNEFLNVLQRPEYRSDVIIGGSTVTEPFVESGKFRPLKAVADTDLFVRDTSLERLANDINSAMSSRQGNIFMEIDRSRATPSFMIGAKVGGERVGIIEAHTFSAFPDVMKQTTQLSLKGGGTLTAVAPEYTLRSKLAGSMFAFRYSKEEGVGFAYKRLKDFPDVISLTREASSTYPATADVFKRLSDDYTKMISSNRAGIDIKDVAAARFAKPEWVAANKGVTLESLTREMTADLRGYQAVVKGFGNTPFGVSRPAIETTSRFGVSFFSPEIKYTPAIKYQLFTGSPERILKETSFRISPSMETKDGPWSNIQHAVFDKYLIKYLPEKEAAVVKATSPAVRAAYSNLFTPVQRAPFGELPTTSASRATMGKVVKGLEQFGPDFIEGGSRAQNVWLGEAGPYESKFGSDFDTYAKNVVMTNEAFRSIVGSVKGEFPRVELTKGTHPGTNPDVAKTQASVTTIAGEEFFHIKPIEKYGYMTELPPVKVEAIGGASAYVVDARLLFKRSTAGMFSGIEQPMGGAPRLVLDRPKDIVPARALARSFAETLYKPPTFDAGGIFTRAKVGRAATLERYSDAILDYSRSLPKEQRDVVTGMMSEARVDWLKGVDRSPQPSIDVVTGKGWLDRPTRGWNEEATFMPGRGREFASGEMISKKSAEFIGNTADWYRMYDTINSAMKGNPNMTPHGRAAYQNIGNAMVDIIRKEAPVIPEGVRIYRGYQAGSKSAAQILSLKPGESFSSNALESFTVDPFEASRYSKSHLSSVLGYGGETGGVMIEYVSRGTERGLPTVAITSAEKGFGVKASDFFSRKTAETEIILPPGRMVVTGERIVPEIGRVLTVDRTSFFETQKVSKLEKVSFGNEKVFEGYPQQVSPQTRLLGSQEAVAISVARRQMDYPVVMARAEAAYPMMLAYGRGIAKPVPALFATVENYSRSSFISKAPAIYPGFASTRAVNYPVSQFTQRYPTITPVAQRSLYPVTQPTRATYPVSTTARSLYPTSATSRGGYPIGSIPEFYRTATTGRGGGGQRNAFFGYTPITSLTTYVYPGMERTTKKRKRKARKSDEWYIWNPVALFESVFGYNVREVWPGQFPLKSSELDFSKRQRKPKFIGPYKPGPSPW